MAEKGSITFSTALDNSQLEKDYQQAVKQVEKLEKDLEKSKDTRTGLEDALDKAAEAADRARQKLKELEAEQQRLQEIANGSVRVGETPEEQLTNAVNAKGRLAEITDEIKDQTKEMERQANAADKLLPKIEAQEQKEKELTEALETQRGAAVQIESEMAKMAEAANVPNLKQKFATLFSGIAKTAAKFAKRIQTMFMKVFLFSVILKGLRELKELIGSAVENNDEASAALARLKGAFLTMIQPIIDAVVPALTWLMNVLTKVMVVLGRFTSFLFGQSYEQSKKNAKALHGEADGIEDVGKAAKNANGYLAGFDELNTMSDTSSEGIAPDWNFDDSLKDFGVYEEGVAEVADGVETIFEGMGKVVDGVLNGDIDLAFEGLHEVVDGVGGTLHGLADMIVAFFDQITGGQFSEYFGQFKEHLHGFIDGLVEFGHGVLDVIKGILTGDIDLILSGVSGIFSGLAHMFEAKWHLILDIAQGVIFAFLDWIDEVTGGAVHDIIAGVKMFLTDFFRIAHDVLHEVVEDVIKMFNGIIEFLAGVFTGDWDRAWKGLADTGKGFLNGVIAIFEGFLNLIVAGINTIGSMLGEFKIDVPEWVPKFGGESWTFGIPKLSEVKLPRLASGAVIPPNREFAAVLGDQQSGYNVEAPEDLIRAIVREESGNDEIIGLLGSILQAVQDGHNIYVDKRILGKVASQQIGNMTRMGGATV